MAELRALTTHFCVRKFAELVQKVSLRADADERNALFLPRAPQRPYQSLVTKTKRRRETGVQLFKGQGKTANLRTCGARRGQCTHGANVKLSTYKGPKTAW